MNRSRNSRSWIHTCVCQSPQGYDGWKRVDHDGVLLLLVSLWNVPLPEGQNVAALLFHGKGPRAFAITLRAPTHNSPANLDVVAVIDRMAHQHGMFGRENSKVLRDHSRVTVRLTSKRLGPGDRHHIVSILLEDSTHRSPTSTKLTWLNLADGHPKLALPFEQEIQRTRVSAASVVDEVAKDL